MEMTMPEATTVVVDKPKTELPITQEPAAPPEGQNTGEQAPPAAPEGEQPEKPESNEEAERKKLSRRFDRRIGNAYRARAEAEARAKLLEEELSKLRNAQAPQAQPGEPKLENFSSVEEWQKAHKEFVEKETEKRLTAKQQQTEQQRFQESLTASWEERASEGQEKYEDWDEVVGDLKPTAPWVAALMQADNAHEIAYHLGKNVKEAERIAKLHPLAQIREIGKLEAKLALTPEKPKAPSKAPAPVVPLTGTTPPETGPTDTDSMEAWMKKRTKQVHGKR